MCPSHQKGASLFSVNLIHNFPIRHGPGQFCVMRNLLNIMIFLFAIPNPQRVPQNIPDTNNLIPRNGHEVKSTSVFNPIFFNNTIPYLFFHVLSKLLPVFNTIVFHLDTGIMYFVFFEISCPDHMEKPVICLALAMSPLPFSRSCRDRKSSSPQRYASYPRQDLFHK